MEEETKKITDIKGQDIDISDIITIPTPTFKYVVGIRPDGYAYLFRTPDKRDWLHEYLGQLYKLVENENAKYLILIRQGDQQDMTDMAEKFALLVTNSYKKLKENGIEV